MNRQDVIRQGKRRAMDYDFAQPVTNVSAGPGNPRRHGYFVRLRGQWVECTNGIGDFWEVAAESVFPEHLSYPECEEAFAPIHKAIYG